MVMLTTPTISMMLQIVLILISIILFITYTARTDNTVKLEWSYGTEIHITFMLFGFGLVATTAATAFRSVPAKDRNIRKLVHALLNLLGFVLMLIGIYRMFQVKEDRGANHLTSLHGWMGIITLILMFIMYIVGAIFFNPYLSIRGAVRAAVKPFHVCGGVTVLLLGLLSTFTGFHLYIYFKPGAAVELTGTSVHLIFSALFLLLGILVLLHTLGLLPQLVRRETRQAKTTSA